MKYKHYFKLSPEVPGELADDCEIEHYDDGYEVIRASLYFDDWFGDDIIEVHPIYAVTALLRTAIEENQLTGCFFDDIKIEKSPKFDKLNDGEVELPYFYWLRVNGEIGSSDFVIYSKRLVVTERAVLILKQANVRSCGFGPFSI